MHSSAQRAYLAEVESRLAAGQEQEVEASLAMLAGSEVALGEDELRGARRRAVQLLAAGGDPRRALELEGRAVSAIATDLDSGERRAALAEGLEALREIAADLPEVRARIDRLLADGEIAWRWFACTLLVEELDSD